MIRDYVANQSKDNNKISHRIMCSGYYSPHIKGDKYLSFKGGQKGANYRYNGLRFVIVPFLNCYIITACVIVCYNALQSVKQ